MKSLVHGVRLLRRGPAALAGVLLIAASAYAHTIGPSFTEAVDLGTTTEWGAAGITSGVADIPDVEDYGANYFKFRVVERGSVLVWSSGNISPRLQVFGESAAAIGPEGQSRREVVLDAGVHYVRARSRDPGRYRLHIAGGGKGHDDVGNTVAQATLLSQSDTDPWNAEVTLTPVARLNYGRDRDWYRFDVPEGPPVAVRIWSSGSTDTFAFLYDKDDIQLERNDDSGAGSNFFIDRVLYPGTYFIGVYGANNDTVGSYRLHLAGRDDHGNFFVTSSLVTLPSVTPASLEYRSDADLFWFRVTTPGTVQIQTTGPAETIGVLYDAFKVELTRAELHTGSGINTTLEEGIYYVLVAQTRLFFLEGDLGSYALHLSGDALDVGVTVPLVLAHGNTRTLEDGSTLEQRSFVRVINHSNQPVDVEITAVDDMGTRRELPSPLKLAAWETRHFNSQDLEQGNEAKGVVGGVGDGTGDWYLEIAPSRPEVEVLSYVRTSDGFLTSMHTQVPSHGRTHRVVTFNPGSNSDRKSKLRLIHPRCPQFETDFCEAANVTIYGVDDEGTRSPSIRLQIAPGAAREVTAAQLEGLEDARDLVGSFGKGERKWQLFITADQPIRVMSLLERAAGHLTNFSAAGSRQSYPTP